MALPALLWRIRRGSDNTVRRYLLREPLRAASVALVLTTVWTLLSLLFLAVLVFLSQELYLPLKPRLLESLLSLFFFALFFLVGVSDTVLVWGALFRSRAAVFHAQLPVPERALYWSAAIEGGLWSSWAVAVLAAPLVAVLAREAAQPWLYMPAAALAMLAFILCAIAVGGLGSLVLARAIPLLRRGTRGIVMVVTFALVGGGLFALSSIDPGGHPLTFMHDVIGRLSFAENPYLPPWWTQQALAAALESRWGDWGYHVGLLALTAATLAVVGEAIAGRRLRGFLDELSGRPERGGGNRTRAWRPLPLLPGDLGLLAAKDLRLFRRDPAQVLQFTMFFGMLGFYLLMLPRLGRAFMLDANWRQVVSVLNLTAIAMALATFTGRFVYPMLSLEGRRLWVLALAPWPRARIVTAKLAFALVVGVPVSLGLTVISGMMLDLAAELIAYQALVIGALGVGLAAGALGLGARFADYGEDNPAKLVAGYGGTVNLLVSVLFCGALIAGAAVPLAIGERWAWFAGGAWTLALTAAWTLICLRMAWRRFGHLG
ncbi:MAG TPA: hypothetical protein VEL07_18935 [Planctomycetota bacterium]|nr:hypothetical protein [Planctomycetota bacterium]